LRIPVDADQRSGLKPITQSGRWRSAIPGDADHSFRSDPNQLLTIAATVIAMPGMVITISPKRFPQGGVALDITEGKLFLLFDLREGQGADQEIVHAQDQGSPPPSL
jgi:hypothetical protein